MTTWKYSDHLKRRVVAAYLAGDPVKRIAARYDLTSQTVSTILNRAGVQRKRSDCAKQRIISSFQPDLGIADIARRAGVSHSYVRTVMRDCGLKFAPACGDRAA
jgi:transposase-like protein